MWYLTHAMESFMLKMKAFTPPMKTGKKLYTKVSLNSRRNPNAMLFQELTVGTTGILVINEKHCQLPYSMIYLEASLANR